MTSQEYFRTVGSVQIGIALGDLTEYPAEAIVNPANDRLQLGGGVAGQIYLKGGEAIQQECDRIGGTPVGTAVWTTAGQLPYRGIVHAVGPQMGEGDEDQKLHQATRAALEVADTQQVASLALPAISTGIFGFPLARCAFIMLDEIIRFAARPPAHLRKAVVVLYDQSAWKAFAEEWTRLDSSIT